MERGAGDPTAALIVSSWFPSVDDLSRGRFVADQVQALAAGGRYRPIVISFDSVGMAGSPTTQRDEAAAILGLTERAIGRRPRMFSRSSVNGPPGVPVARLALAGGWGGPPSVEPVCRRDATLATLDPIIRGVGIVHAHNAYPDGASAISTAERLGLPLVITEHASFIARILAEPIRRASYLQAIDAASRVIAVSAMLGGELSAAVPGLAEKMVIIPNAVEVEAFTPRPLAERRVDELLYVGYRIDSKGLPLLLRSFREIRRRRPDATLRLIGRSPDQATEDRWLETAKDLGILDGVSFEPPAPRPAIAEALARASLLVHASPRETFGMTAAESLASGTPVVAIDSGGVTETIGSDGRLGEIVKEQDPAAFAAAVVRTLERRATFDPAALRASIVERYGAPIVAGRIADLYDEVRSESRSPNPEAAPGGWEVPAASPADRSILVVGFLTNRTERILRMYRPEMLGKIDVLCASGPAVATLPDGLHAVTDVDIDGPYRIALGPYGERPRASSIQARVARLVRDPVGVFHRRRVRAQRESYRLAEAQAALEAAIGGRGARLATTVVVGVTGLDYMAIERVPEAAARIAPGGLRWLADLLADSGAPERSGKVARPAGSMVGRLRSDASRD